MAFNSTNSNGTFSNGTDDSLAGFSPLVSSIFIAYYAVVFTIATVGNGFALVACYKNYSISSALILSYIASLASADLMFALLSMFDLVYFIQGDWPGGEPTCKIQGTIIETSYSASVLTLVAISYERKKAVSKPFLALSQSKNRRHYLPAAIWVVAMMSTVPLLYAYSTFEDHNGKLWCLNETWGDVGRQVYYGIQAVLLFLVPLGFMVWAHIKIFKTLKRHVRTSSVMGATTVDPMQQRRVTKMLFAVTIAFSVCYVPFIIIRTLRYFYVYSGDEIWRLVQLLIFTQTAVNPIIYCFYGRMFKISYRDILRCKFNCLTIEESRKPRSSSAVSTSSYIWNYNATPWCANVRYSVRGSTPRIGDL